MQAVQNLGMAVVTMMAGRIVDDQGYLVLEVFFLAWLCCKFDFCFTLITPSSNINLFFINLLSSFAVSLVATVLIWVMNASRGGLLNMSVAERDKHERELMYAFSWLPINKATVL